MMATSYPEQARAGEDGNGRTLGPKGAKTRQRLLDAAAVLLETVSPVSLTAAAITRGAGVSPPSFYVYFNDVGDIVHDLALAANNDLASVMAVLRRWREGELGPSDGARAFVRTFREHWQQYRPILNVRNLEADRGDPRFLAMRQDAGHRIIRELADLIMRGRSVALAPIEATARATVVFAAIERIAATELLYPVPAPDMPSSDQLAEAEVAILVELIAP